MGCLFGYCGRPDNGILRSMTEVLKHRSARGCEFGAIAPREDLVVEIGHGIASWTRATAPQVMTWDGGRKILGYSGLLFNPEILFEKADGEDSPSEQARIAWEHDPEDFLKGLDGAFVMAYAHGDDLYLVRDPAGMKALYWTVHRDRLLFASEIKALFADRHVDRKMRIPALPEYLTFSFVPGAGTMFEGIEELQPGCILKYSEGRVSVRRHFTFEDLEFDESRPPIGRDYVAELRTELENAVRNCRKACDEPPAVFLSGGIDSSSVLALTAGQFPDARIKTFSVHFGESYAHENEFVSMMTDRYSTDHTWLEIRPSGFLEKFRSIIWSLDDPIGDPITVPNYLMAEAASKVTNVVFNGEGGDPCFGGPKNIPMILSQVYGPRDDGVHDGWLERDYLLSFRKCFNDLGDILDPAVLRESGGEDALISVVAPFFRCEKPRGFLNKLMAMNIRLKGANLILVKVDKMTSANGVLALAPLFTRRIIEAAMAGPPRLKLDGSIEKALLKKAVEDIVPRPIVDRPKSGMMVPVKFWFRKEMRSYAKRLLSKRNLDKVGYFNTKYVRKLLDYDLRDIHGLRYGTKLWMLITFMLWHERMIEAPSITADRSRGSVAKGLWRRFSRSM